MLEPLSKSLHPSLIEGFVPDSPQSKSREPGSIVP